MEDNIFTFASCRFHLLAEFDDGKRSCRKRLAGHNERRRKPQLDNHSGRTGKMLSSCHGIWAYVCIYTLVCTHKHTHERERERESINLFWATSDLE